jgi:hypothetical protein
LSSITIGPRPGASPSPRWHWLIVAALMAGQLWCGVFAAVASSDTSRDVYFAQQIALGQAFPLTGPAINAALHLGPLWYYLLAVPLLLVPNAAAVTGTMGLLSATQFPLAYLLGRRLCSAGEGLLFAACLALPGWIVTAFGSLTHPIMVIPSLLLAAFVALAYRARPDAWRAGATGGVLALMCAAHPTLVLPGILLLAWCMVHAPRRALALAHAGLMAAIVFASLAPMLYEQWQVGFADAATAAAYTSTEWSRPSLGAALELIHAVVVFGPQYVTRYWLGLSPQASQALFGVYLALVVLAGAGLLLRAWQERSARRCILGLAGLLLLHSLFVTAIRAQMPPWMIYAHWLFVAALLALGLGWYLRFRLAGPVFGLLLAFTSAWTVSIYAWLNGTTVFANIQPSPGKHGFMDVRDYEDREGPSFRLPRVPFHQLFALGEALCEPVSLYGHYAQQIDYTYAASAMRACRTSRHVQFGGMPQPGRKAWFGLTRAAWEELGLHPERWLGNLGTGAPYAVWHSPVALTPVVPTFANFPRTLAGEVEEFTLEFAAPADVAVLASHRAHRLLPFEVIRVRADGRAVPPGYSDLTAAVFLPPSPAAVSVRWQLEVRANPNYVDVLGFRAEPAR